MKKFNYQDINIVYEDNHILVVVKPQNVPICPDQSKDDNILDLLKEYLVKTYEKAGDAYLGLVHRLDRPTGGVVVFAKTSKAAARLSASLQDGSFEKKYFAITIGVPKVKKSVLKHMLYKDMDKNEVFVVPMATEGAKMAILEYKTVNENSGYALLDIKLITGRSHQARVQLSAIGTPIFGDQKYAQGKTPLGYNLALWATEIRFPHPTTREMMVFCVMPPPDELPWNKFNIPTLF